MDESYPLQEARPAARYTLRPARPDDFDFAWALYRGLMRDLSREIGLWHEPVQRAMIRSAINGNEVSIILSGGQPAGWLQIQDAEDAVYVHHLYIAPDHQRRGVGTRLLKKILRQARDRAKPVHLWVMRNNQQARRLYQRLGFAVVDEDKVKFHLVCEGG
jgi:ribosomal protein S18 acetylase RimI-like enzyme